MAWRETEAKPQQDQGILPRHPQNRGAHLFKDEVAVIGAVIGASWKAPRDPCKGLRGAAGGNMTFTVRGLERRRRLFDALVEVLRYPRVNCRAASISALVSTGADGG